VKYCNSLANSIGRDCSLKKGSFLELTNNGLSDENLTDWLVSGGIEFAFPSGTMLAAGESLVLVSFDTGNTDRLNAFRTQYNVSQSARIVGAFSGRLSNSGEAVRLERPGQAVAGTVPTIVVDEVVYDDLEPWAPADANGQSLQRRSGIQLGNLSETWFGTVPTVGFESFANAAPGEFTGDGTIDAQDIDALFDAIARGSNVVGYDLNGDSVVDAEDANFLITQIIGTLFGDANLDRSVDVSDFNAWNSNKFGACSGGWSAGDFNGDGGSDVSDFNLWNNNKFQSAARPTHEDSMHDSRAVAERMEEDSIVLNWRGFETPDVDRDSQNDEEPSTSRIDSVFANLESIS
jgi:hypothetical protein